MNKNDLPRPVEGCVLEDLCCGDAVPWPESVHVNVIYFREEVGPLRRLRAKSVLGTSGSPEETPKASEGPTLATPLPDWLVKRIEAEGPSNEGLDRVADMLRRVYEQAKAKGAGKSKLDAIENISDRACVLLKRPYGWLNRMHPDSPWKIGSPGEWVPTLNNKPEESVMPEESVRRKVSFEDEKGGELAVHVPSSPPLTPTQHEDEPKEPQPTQHEDEPKEPQPTQHEDEPKEPQPTQHEDEPKKPQPVEVFDSQKTLKDRFIPFCFLMFARRRRRRMRFGMKQSGMGRRMT